MSDAFNIENWLQSTDVTSKDKMESYINIFIKMESYISTNDHEYKTDKIIETMDISLLAHRVHILKHINLLRSKTINKISKYEPTLNIAQTHAKCFNLPISKDWYLYITKTE
eukprot:78639_1